MDSNPYLIYADVLHSQQDTAIGSQSSPIPLFGTQAPEGSNLTSSHAAKARGKKPMVDGKEVGEFQTMWKIKQEDLAHKEKLQKMKLLEKLFEKQEPLPDYEEDLKKKLIRELM
ncbi:hypothetical protein Bca4012_017662 [Brassica carinata]